MVGSRLLLVVVAVVVVAIVVDVGMAMTVRMLAMMMLVVAGQSLVLSLPVPGLLPIGIDVESLLYDDEILESPILSIDLLPSSDLMD